MTARFFFPDEGGSGGGALSDRFGALFEEFGAYIRQFQRGGRINVDLLDDRIGRAGWRNDGEPRAGNQVGQADLRRIGRVGRDRAAAAPGDPEELHLSRLLEAQGRGDVAEEDIDAAGRDVQQRRPFALVGDVHELHARLGREHFRGQVRCRSVALACIGHLAGIGLGVGDELLGRSGR